MSFEYNIDIVTRDTFLFGKYDPNVYANEKKQLPGYEGISGEDLAKLMEVGYIDPNGSHEGSPLYKEFVDFLLGHPDYTGIGSITSSKMFIDGVIKNGPVTSEEEVQKLVDTFPDPDIVRVDAPVDDEGNTIEEPRVVLYYSHVLDED